MPISFPSRRTVVRAVLLVGSLTLAGCAHTNDVLAKSPEEVFHSPQSAEQVASCFEDLNHLRLIEREDSAKVARFRNGYGGVVKTFSIYPEGTGGRIEMRSDAISVPGIKWKRCVGLKPMKRDA